MVRRLTEPKRWSAPLLIAALFLGLACRGANAEETVEVTDMAGTRMRVPRRIRKVIPLGGALRFMVYMRSLDLVTGVENVERKWTSAGRLYGLATAEKARSVPVIGEGGPGRLPDFEAIIAVWPDVILAMGIDPAQAQTVREKTGIPVFTLSYGDPGTLDPQSVREAIRCLGNLLNRQARADKVVAYMDRLAADLRERTAVSAPDETTSAYVGGISYKGTQGITSTEARHAPLDWAGGRNAADEIGRPGHFFIDPEKLLLWDPDTIFLDAGSLANVAEDNRKKPGFYRKLRAVNENRVFLILPHNYYHTNIEIAFADAYFMGKTLHPECFADIDPAAKADEIFNVFVGVPAYRRLAEEFHGFGRVRFAEDGLSVH